MATHDCYVRIYLPFQPSGRVPADYQFGHFDLQINSADGETTLPFDNHTPFLQPVFSYVHHGNYGFVEIFDSETPKRQLDSHHMICKFHFTTTSTMVTAFIQYMQTMLNYSTTYSTSTCPSYHVVSGPFQTYSAERKNSFGATAEWCNLLDMDILRNIYYSEGGIESHMHYSAWNMFDTNHRSWQFHNLIL